MQFRKAVQWSHSIIRDVIGPGDCAIDATAGNGHDTQFLCGLVAPNGRVYSFDIQPQAITSTASRLEKAGINSSLYQLVCDSHANMNQHIGDTDRPKIKAIMFNFGYLPGGDHSLVTKAETSLQAVRQSLDLLAPGGRMTLTFYTGHPGGPEEADTIQQYIAHISPSDFVALTYKFLNLPNNPPYVVAVERTLGG